MKLNEYKPGDNVQVHVFNPQKEEYEWVDGIVTKINDIYDIPTLDCVVVVKFTRVVARDSTPEYIMINHEIPYYTGSFSSYNEEEVEEGFIYESEIQLKRS